MTTAREVMTFGTECASVDDTVTDAARKMKDLGVGALPDCGKDNRLQGMITDRDIVLNCVADGMDTTQVRVQDYAGVEVVTIGADDDIEEALDTMATRRRPPASGHRRA